MKRDDRAPIPVLRVFPNYGRIKEKKWLKDRLSGCFREESISTELELDFPPRFCTALKI